METDGHNGSKVLELYFGAEHWRGCAHAVTEATRAIQRMVFQLMNEADEYSLQIVGRAISLPSKRWGIMTVDYE